MNAKLLALVLTGTALAMPVRTDACGDLAELTRPIDLAICLDTSNSMDNLIDSARQQLWSIVNELALAEPTPELRVALLSFGNSGYDGESGWVRLDAPFTSDLDLISQKLFGLTTNGGNEYVGRVLSQAAQLEWHGSSEALKLVVVAGNESADQDKVVGFRDVCKGLIARDIMVNAVYCGPEDDAIAPGSRKIALLSDGKFASINIEGENAIVVVESPFDAQLTDLSSKLNTTYLPFGAQGAVGCRNQSAQDDNASTMNQAAAAARSSTKAGQLYNCGSWDLVDAASDAKFNLAAVPVEDLPEIMRPMKLTERVAHIQAMGVLRNSIKAEINRLSAQRATFVSAERNRLAIDDTKSFDRALLDAIREQAQSRGFVFSPPMAAASDAPKAPETAASGG